MPEPLPVDQLADPELVLGLLGSFWARTYAGRDQLAALAGAAGDAAGQAQLDLAELVDCLARRTVPTHHRERWRVLYLRRSQRLTAAPAFGAAGAFGDGGTRYGDVPAEGPPAWPCDLAALAVIGNRLTAPSRTLIAGIDFTLGPGRIAFRADPFADPLLAARDLVDESGRAVDREVALWCFAAGSDREYLYEQFAYVLGLRLPSGPAYRDLVNALLDALVGGTALEQVMAALAAITGTPLAAGAETVELTAYDAHGLAVITDRGAYRFPAGATPVVVPGDAVRAGDALVDTVEVREMNDGLVPPGLAALAVGDGLLLPGFYADLVFADRAVPLVVEEGPGRFTKVSWELGGYPGDVARFWDEVHERGLARGQTLAHLLDVRPEPATEPGAGSLPATVNPLAFLVANLLRGNALFCRIRAGGLGPGGLGLGQLRLLRRVLPPHACLLTLIDLPPRVDFAKMGPSGDGPDTYDAGPPLAEAVPRSRLQDGPSRVRNRSETCQ